HIQSDKTKDSIEKTQRKLTEAISERVGLGVMSDYLETLKLNSDIGVSFHQGDVIDPSLFTANKFKKEIISILEGDYWSFLVCGRFIQNERITLYLAPIQNIGVHNFYNYYKSFIG